VIYGRSKTGKTTFASTFPGPALLVDIRDHGTDSVSDTPGMDIAETEDYETFEEVYWFLKEGGHEYKTVILDTVTQLQQLVLEDVCKNKRKGDSPGDWGSMTQREWGDAASTLKEWIIRFRDLPMEVVFLAQERTRNTADDNASDNTMMPEVGPALMPSVATVMNANVDIIAHTYVKVVNRTKEVNGVKKKVEDIVYSLRIGPDPIYTTGIRKPRAIEVPHDVPNATFQDIIDIIKGD
jgi:phage nucleotide-binding protein